MKPSPAQIEALEQVRQCDGALIDPKRYGLSALVIRHLERRGLIKVRPLVFLTDKGRKALEEN